MGVDKSRSIKSKEYEMNYGHIPVDYEQRLSWLYDELKITPNLSEEILRKKDEMINSLYYNNFTLILFEIPEGAPRPRFITKYNMAQEAINNPAYVQVYSIGAKDDSLYMRRMIDENELKSFNGLIYTPCNIDICTFSPTPKSYSKIDTILAEIGLERPLSKPDWDNIEKKYSDMFNKNIWIDDTFVVDGSIHKFYSVLPRIEIRIKYMNMVYNKYQYKNIMERYNPETTITFPGGVN